MSWYTTRPIGDRSPFTGRHEFSDFTASWADTLQLLAREVNALSGRHVVIEVDVPERAIRADGMLRADARAATPAVRVAFDSRHGPLAYATDRFVKRAGKQAKMDDWQHNVRAIALGLEALRRVDRYSISRRGEQYQGYKALPPGSIDGFASTDEVLAWMRARIPEAPAGADARDLYKALARRLHPDAGGRREDWDRLDHARQLLEAGGLL